MQAIFNSRKALLGLFCLVFVVLGMVWPETREMIDKWGVLLFAIYAVATGMITIEDSVQAWAKRPLTIGGAIEMIAEGVKEAEAPKPPAPVPPLPGTEG